MKITAEIIDIASKTVLYESNNLVVVVHSSNLSTAKLFQFKTISILNYSNPINIVVTANCVGSVSPKLSTLVSNRISSYSENELSQAEETALSLTS